jgi:hypothetical protein
MAGTVRLDIDGAIATITNDNPDKHNAFDDDMDVALFDILDELHSRQEVRAVVWRAEGRSWSSGRDVSAIGTNRTELTHHQLMSRGHEGIQRLWAIQPINCGCRAPAGRRASSHRTTCSVPNTISQKATTGRKTVSPTLGSSIVARCCAAESFEPFTAHVA